MLGDIASIATLILFVFYFIGRTFSIIRMRTLFRDEIAIVRSNHSSSQYQIVETFEIDENPYNSFILTSREGIYSLSIYRVKWDVEYWQRIGRVKIGELPFLNVGQSVEIRLTIPELFTTCEIEYFTSDYRKIKIPVVDNPKSGVESEFVEPKHTWRSVLYHIFK